MHKKYLDQFCGDFKNKMQDMIMASIAEHKVAETDNLLYIEVVQHTLFCKKKIQVVYGRKSTLKVKGYMIAPPMTSLYWYKGREVRFPRWWEPGEM